MTIMLNEQNYPQNENGKKRSVDDELNDLFGRLNATDEISDEVYNLLPQLFTDLVKLFIEKQEKETAVFCALTLLSGVLPNYKVVHDGIEHEPNLYGYVYGTAGVGKGVLRKCTALVEPIHREKTARARKAMLEFEAAINGKKRKKKNQILNDDTIEREEVPESESSSPLSIPPDELLIIPANNSKSNIYKLLNENDGRGIICETEASTLIAALKQDFGSFVDLLLAAYHHEPFRFSRKADRTIEIENPCLSILLSSTIQTVTQLFGNTENGLFSRFIFHRVYSTPEFKSPFGQSGQSTKTGILKLAETVKSLHDELLKFKGMPVYFRFTSKQEKLFAEMFQQNKDEYRELYGEHLYGVVHRYGLVFTRVAMILSILRTYQQQKSLKNLDNEVVCSDNDFKCSSLIVRALFNKAVTVYELLLQQQKAIMESIGSDSTKYSKELHTQELLL